MTDTDSQQPSPTSTVRAGDPVPVTALAAPPADQGLFARRRRERAWDEQYRPAPIWKRILSVIALGSISLATGVMVATGIAAAIAALAIALQSLVT